jgi:hypothetical protein
MVIMTIKRTLYKLVVLHGDDMVYESKSYGYAGELMELYDVMQKIYAGLDCDVAILRNEISVACVTRV